MEKDGGESMAQARKKRQVLGNGGFTLSEMLAAVAVLTLLLALSLPALGELRREIRQKELDSKAYGHMLIQLPENEVVAGRMLSYLESQHITYAEEEV